MLKPMPIERFDEVFSIMEQCFPADEYRSYEDQRALLFDPCYRIYCHFIHNEIVAFLALWMIQDYVFLEHFAVSPAFRNKGLGTKLVAALHSLNKNRVILEVELPETDIQCRRIRFYERNGFYYNPYPYFQPALSPGKQAVPLRIMTSQARVEEVEFLKIRALLYHSVYGVSKPDSNVL